MIFKKNKEFRMSTKTVRSIYTYLNLSQFLSDRFDAEKQKDSLLTVKAWAARVGFDSPDAFINILKGKSSLKMKLAVVFEKGLNLDASEFNYFKALILYSNLKLDEEKKVLEVLLTQYRPKSSEEAVVRVNDGTIFSSWLDGAILEMGKLQNVQTSEIEIESRLRKKVTKELLNERIVKLCEAGLLKRSQDGSLKTIHDSVSTTTDYPIPSVQKYYSEVSQLAMEAATLPAKEREFQCFSMAMNKEDLTFIKTMIRDFRTRVENSVSGNDLQDVYQINLQCFPVTHEETKVAASTSE